VNRSIGVTSESLSQPQRCKRTTKRKQESWRQEWGKYGLASLHSAGEKKVVCSPQKQRGQPLGHRVGSGQLKFGHNRGMEGSNTSIM